MSLSVGKQGGELLSWLHLPSVSEAWWMCCGQTHNFSMVCPRFGSCGAAIGVPRSQELGWCPERSGAGGMAQPCHVGVTGRPEAAALWGGEQAVHRASSRVFELPKTGHQLTLGDGKRTQAQAGFPLWAACCHEEQAVLVALTHYLNLFLKFPC